MLDVGRFLGSSSVSLARKIIFVSNLALRHVTPPECLGINTQDLGRAILQQDAHPKP